MTNVQARFRWGQRSLDLMQTEMDRVVGKRTRDNDVDRRYDEVISIWEFRSARHAEQAAERLRQWAREHQIKGWVDVYPG